MINIHKIRSSNRQCVIHRNNNFFGTTITPYIKLTVIVKIKTTHAPRSGQGARYYWDVIDPCALYIYRKLCTGRQT